MLQTPVLFIVFNRPEHTHKVLEYISKVKPKHLYIAADGPRKHNSKDLDKCNEVREVIRNGIDWECEVRTLFRDENLGCGKAVSLAITWFFENEEQGIILEDDCIPNSGFFQFSEFLLNYFKHDERIMHIGGGSFVNKKHLNATESYYYSKYAYCWGWSTWKRAWIKYNFDMIGVDQFIEHDLQIICQKKSEFDFWARTLTDVKNGKIDTWDFQWNYAIWVNRGLCVHSCDNYILNIGFDKEATHTKIINEHYENITVNDFTGNIVHPVRAEINQEADWDVFAKYNLSEKKSFVKKMWDSLFNRTKHGRS